LEDLALVNVYWTGEFKRKIWLPSLRRFSDNRNYDSTTVSPDKLMDSIFFYSDQAAFQSWNKSSLYTSRADVTIENSYSEESSELKFSLSFDSDLAKLHVMNYPHDLSKYFPYTELDLKATVWDVAAASTNKVTHVTARDVELINWNQPQLPHLTSLTLEVTNEPRLTLDLSLLPAKTLEEIDLSNIDLVSTSALPLRFEALQSLKLYSLCFNASGGILSSPSLKSLHLKDLECPKVEIDLSRPLRNQAGLVEFRLSDSESFDLSDLEASKGTLEHLYLEDVGLVFQSAPFQFNDLKTLRIRSQVTFTPLQLFHTTFQNAETIGFQDFSFKPGFLEEVLKTRVNFMEFSFLKNGRPKAKELDAFFAQAGVDYNYADEIQLQKRSQTWKYKVFKIFF
jgi:hypothetical protein